MYVSVPSLPGCESLDTATQRDVCWIQFHAFSHSTIRRQYRCSHFLNLRHALLYFLSLYLLISSFASRYRGHLQVITPRNNPKLSLCILFNSFVVRQVAPLVIL